MQPIWIVALTAVYVLIGVRIGIVAQRAEVRIERNDKMYPILAGIMWPGLVVVLGLGTLIVGNSGIYDSAHKSRQ